MTWMVTAISVLIYASPIAKYREELWTYLRWIDEKIKLAWLLVGDYNQIVHETEKSGKSDRWRRTAGSLWELIEDCDFIDLGFLGTKLSWTIMRPGGENIMERLDMTFCNQAWNEKFPATSLSHLPRTHSDHCLILINTAGHNIE